MGDPLSLTAGIVGLAKASYEIGNLLRKITTGLKHAPKHAETAQSTVEETITIIKQLEHFLLRLEAADTICTGYLEVDHVRVLLSSCIQTYSELHDLVKDLVPKDMTLLDRAKWMTKESHLQRIIDRLQTHKSSLSLVLVVFTGASILDVKTTIAQLNSNITRSYQDMSERLLVYEARSSRKYQPSTTTTDDDGSIITVRPTNSLKSNVTEQTRFEFEALLKTSRPYRKIDFRPTSYALSLDEPRTLGISFLSGLSFSEISNASVINLLITSDEISNKHYYYNEALSRKNSSTTIDRDRRSRIAATAELHGVNAAYIVPGSVHHIPPVIIATGSTNQITKALAFTARCRTTQKESLEVVEGYRDLRVAVGEIVDVLDHIAPGYHARRPQLNDLSVQAEAQAPHSLYYVARKRSGTTALNLGWIDTRNFDFMVNCIADHAFRRSQDPLPFFRHPQQGIGAFPGLFCEEIKNIVSIAMVIDIDYGQRELSAPLRYIGNFVLGPITYRHILGDIFETVNSNSETTDEDSVLSGLLKDSDPNRAQFGAVSHSPTHLPKRKLRLAFFESEIPQAMSFSIDGLLHSAGPTAEEDDAFDDEEMSIGALGAFGAANVRIWTVTQMLTGSRRPKQWLNWNWLLMKGYFPQRPVFYPPIVFVTARELAACFLGRLQGSSAVDQPIPAKI